MKLWILVTSHKKLSNFLDSQKVDLWLIKEVCKDFHYLTQKIPL